MRCKVPLNTQWENTQKRCWRVEGDIIPWEEFFSFYKRFCFLYSGLRYGKKRFKNELEGNKINGFNCYLKFQTLAQKETVLAEEAEIYSLWWFFVGRNVKFLLISHLQREGEYKRTRRNGKRNIWSSLSVAQGFTEHAVLWDFLPPSGISLCATFGS